MGQEEKRTLDKLMVFSIILTAVVMAGCSSTPADSKGNKDSAALKEGVLYQTYKDYEAALMSGKPQDAFFYNAKPYREAYLEVYQNLTEEELELSINISRDLIKNHQSIDWLYDKCSVS